MSTRMLIDATHSEETRVAVVRGNRIDEFDFEAANKKQLRGNIYLARVTRVEPSLQAAFVEYGGNRHGFLAFSEIHPDYYQIPIEDREALLEEEAQVRADSAEDDDDQEDEASASEEGDDESQGPEIEEAGSDDSLDDAEKARSTRVARKYKIQEVIKRRQILLIQVVKEERGNKGAAITTYLSLAGRHCVLMPNTARGGGVSRKIGNFADRKRLKKILSELEVPDGMGCIIRTAGLNRNKAEIKRDYTYLLRQWDSIRQLTLSSTAPALIYEEGNLIKRTIRDMYNSEIDEILIEGADDYRAAKDFMKLMMPSHAKKVQQYKEDVPLFHRYQVESQLEAMFSTTVTLKSGGYLVINPTEALVAIDVNSGKSTKERNVERTAYKTNLEAAEEVARQLRLRDLAGLIVIDFIDMDENRHNRGVERKMKECLKNDRARLQIGRISGFGLMEMSRQRMRPGLLEIISSTCPVCEGSGTLRSTESVALQVLRAIEGEGIRAQGKTISARVPTDVALYILNHKRQELSAIEERYEITVNMIGDETMHRPHFEVRREGGSRDSGNNNRQRNNDRDGDSRNRNNRRGRKARNEDKSNKADRSKDESPEAAAEDGSEEPRKRRRRGKRGGRRRRKDNQDTNVEANAEAVTEETASSEDSASTNTDAVDPANTEQPEVVVAEDTGAEAQPDAAQETASEEETASTEEPKKPTRRRRSRRKAEPAKEEGTAEESAEAAADVSSEEAEVAAEEEAPKKPARRRRRKAEPKAEEKAVEAAEAEAPAPEATAEESPVEATPAEEPTAVEAPATETVAEDASPETVEEAPVEEAPAAEPERPKQPPKTGWWNKPTE